MDLRRTRPTALVLPAMAVLLSCAGTARGDEAAGSRLDPARPYGGSLGEPVTYEVDFAAVVTPPHHAQVLKVAQIGEVAEMTDAEKQALAAAARKRLESGFRDDTWMLWKGTHYDLAPKASRPVPVVRTIYAEADGEPLPDPDPANAEKREFGWMTVHKYTPSREVIYPFKSKESLEEWR